jgi:TonB family protein
LDFRSNGQARLEIKAGDRLAYQVFDGSSLWVYQSWDKNYTRKPATGMPRTEEYNLLLFGRDPANIVSATLAREEQVTFAGKPTQCYVVRAAYKGTPAYPAAKSVVRTVWISQDRDLVLRDRWDSELDDLTQVVETINYNIIECDVPLADDLFVFHPPPGASLASTSGVGGGIGSSPAAETRPAATSSEPVLTRKVEAEYSPQARAAKLQGTVYLYLEVDPDGKPENVQVMHGLGLGLDEKAVEAVKQWQFKPGMAGGQPARTARSVEVQFRLGDLPWRVRQVAYHVTRDPQRAEVLSKPVLSQYANPDPEACPADGGDAFARWSIGEDGLPRDVKTDRPNDPTSQAAVKAVESWRFQPGLANGKPRGASASVVFECGPSIATSNPRIYRVGNGVSPPVLTYRPQPDYSEEARKAKIEGEVAVQVVIDASGHATHPQIVRGLGLGLNEKALETVLQWRFKPGTLNGKPVAVQAQILINFRLE